MSKEMQAPWVTGPGEILKHGLSLLAHDSDTNRRLALISIDNSVELMIKTYLGLPRRVNSLNISRKEYQEFSQNFNDLLDALEKYASAKLRGIDLGEIEWYHRLRNELYHQGNGLTVEKDKVEVYAELANLLFWNLFGHRLVAPSAKASILLGEFMEAWLIIENEILDMANNFSLTGRRGSSVLGASKYLLRGDILPKDIVQQVEKYRKLRNDVVHGTFDHKEVLTEEVVEEIKSLSRLISGQIDK